MLDNKKREIFGKIVLSFFALLLILFGVLHLFRGEMNYPNYWGGVVFAPIAILFGCLLLFVVLFKWKSIEKSDTTFRKNSKMDDYRKW